MTPTDELIAALRKAAKDRVARDWSAVAVELTPEWEAADRLASLSAERDRADQAEAALWRIMPNVYTIEMEGGQKPDQFEGPGETYQDAYVRERDQNKRLVEALKEADALIESWVPDVAVSTSSDPDDIPDQARLAASIARRAALAQPEEQR